jgi:hypothetical protein
MPERLWRVSDLSLEWGALRIHSPVAPVRLAELLPRVGGRRRGLEARRHLPRGVGGWLLRAKEEECGAEEPTCADRTAIVSTCPPSSSSWAPRPFFKKPTAGSRWEDALDEF